MGATECLDVFENCHGGTSQKWTVKSDSSIFAQPSGLCLDAVGGKTANGRLAVAGVQRRR
ncbi:ricin-type beta-trefoil lectin domain protein [Streptomyces sp. NPDC088794]|uniref:ricin-type beta-trefoil lectin domain protein n=1 Tax=Streptomyces sp. NPDC088794 TaxID=3365902 RepID=UPI00381EEC6D